MAFHLYPQLIPQVCNPERFGPPRDVTLASPWPWIARLVSGLIPATGRPVQTRFRCGSACFSLNLATEINSPDHSPKGTPSGFPGDDPKVIDPWHSPSTACKHTVSGSFHSPHGGSFHLSLTVLVHYRSPKVFSLGEWSPLLPTGFRVSRGTQGQRQESSPHSYGAITLYGIVFQRFWSEGGFVTP